MKHILIIIFAFIITVPLMGQETRHEKMQSLKIAFLTKQLELTPTESERFWPIYNMYDKQLHELRQKMKPSKKPSEFTDQEAEDFISLRIDMEQEKVDIQKRMILEIKEVVGAKRAIKMRQVEDRFKRRVLEKMGKKGERRGGMKGGKKGRMRR